MSLKNGHSKYTCCNPATMRFGYVSLYSLIWDFFGILRVSYKYKNMDKITQILENVVRCKYVEAGVHIKNPIKNSYQDGLGRTTQTLDHVVVVHILIWDKNFFQIKVYSDTTKLQNSPTWHRHKTEAPPDCNPNRQTPFCQSATTQEHIHTRYKSLNVHLSQFRDNHHAFHSMELLLSRLHPLLRERMKEG